MANSTVIHPLKMDILPSGHQSTTRRCRAAMGMSSFSEPPAKERKIDCFRRQRCCVEESYGAVFDVNLEQVADMYMETIDTRPNQALCSRDVHSPEDSCEGFYFSPPRTPDELFERSACDTEMLMQTDGMVQNLQSWQILAQRSTTTVPVPYPQNLEMASDCPIEAIYI